MHAPPRWRRDDRETGANSIMVPVRLYYTGLYYTWYNTKYRIIRDTPPSWAVYSNPASKMSKMHRCYACNQECITTKYCITTRRIASKMAHMLRIHDEFRSFRTSAIRRYKSATLTNSANRTSAYFLYAVKDYKCGTRRAPERWPRWGRSACYYGRKILGTTSL